MILSNSRRKPNRMWVDQVSEFYNKSFKIWLKGNDIQVTMNEKMLLLKDLLGL